MSKQKKTRKDTSTELSNYLGKGKEMSPNELPTLRDCLRYGIFLKETDPAYQNKVSHNTRVMGKAILVEMKKRWEKANYKFQPPVTVQDKMIVDKLVVLWTKASKIA